MSELSLTLQHMPNAECKSKWSYLARHYLTQSDEVIDDLDSQDQISKSYELRALSTSSHERVWNFSNYRHILLIGPISFELKLRRLIPGVRSSLTWRAPPQFLWKWRFRLPICGRRSTEIAADWRALQPHAWLKLPTMTFQPQSNDDWPTTVSSKDILEIFVVSGSQLIGGNYIYQSLAYTQTGHQKRDLRGCTWKQG